MKISEIVGSEIDRDEPLANYQRYFNDATRQPVSPPLLNNIRYSYAEDGGNEYYGAFVGNDLVSLLGVNSERYNHPQIFITQTEESFRNRGILRLLMERALDRHGELWSDSTHSKSAREFWENIIQIPGPYNSVYVVDPDSEPRLARSVPHDEIWNNRLMPVLSITRMKKTVNEEILWQKNEEFNRRRNRDSEIMFYMPFNDPQVNP